MAKKEHIERHTADALRARQARGESQSDWARAAAMTEDKIEAAIAEDADEAGMVIDWAQASVETPRPKAVLNMRVDREVMDFFRSQGRGYQTRINAVLRSYVEQMRHQTKR
ncbi:hypothetical protein CCR94_24160 [Rhodoblastus sphagnicola]|uniref:3-oxoacyl-ACP synthase n=1 Tax=Rhodoblastus sphagnicola TaxID=333368 RepID=A0A2S6MTP4_9HYPH|nr:BrnA antitoxin family protein [Rhodoblastus sphagnicola]MBB4197400.1 uncharacterized protein (DUF4415 family) [Rhodoblastus sphagnicola]PPQ25731.1 hypothetical protein CCR94_24160 [Rhodoblastus sphagnicola]